MKRIIICIVFLSMMGGTCFSQSNPFAIPDEYWITFKKGLDLGREGKWAEAFPYFKVVADKGNSSYAQHEVAICYQYGEGVPVNFKEAFNYMYKSATNPKPWATSCSGMALYYTQGIGTKPNLEEAFNWYRKGAEPSPNVIGIKMYPTEISACMFYTGSAYLFGEGVKPNADQAIFWLKKADEHGSPNASFVLGLAYLYGDGIPKNEVEGIKWLRKSAEAGDAEAQYMIGKAYQNGLGNLPKDKSKALEWYKKAATKGFMKALDEIRFLER